MVIGQEVRLMPPAYVKAYVKRGKTDAADAEAIAEAVTRPTIRLVAVKSKAQQAVLMLHKTPDLLVRQRTMLINALRGHLGAYGIVAPQGPAGVQAALKALREEDQGLPELAGAALEGLADQLEHLGAEIGRDAFWSSARPPSCGWHANAAERAGSAICSTGRSARSPQWPWLTRPLASPGP